MFYFYQKKKKGTEGRTYYNWRVGVRVSHPFGNPSPYHGVHSNQKALCLSLPQHLPSVLNHVLTSDSRFHIRNLSTKLKKFFFPTIRKILQTESFQNFKLLPNQIISKHYTTHIQNPNKTQQRWQHTHRSNPPKFRKIKKKANSKTQIFAEERDAVVAIKAWSSRFPYSFEGQRFWTKRHHQ